ncbi:unnamed protein product, partial [Prorocentrum cordatum]
MGRAQVLCGAFGALWLRWLLGGNVVQRMLTLAGQEGVPDPELGCAPGEDVDLMIREATESPNGQEMDAEAPEEPEVVEAAEDCNASADAPEGEGEAKSPSPTLTPVSDTPPREPHLRLPMEGLAPPWVELRPWWRVIYKASEGSYCWAYTQPPPFGIRMREVLQGEIFGPILEVGQNWLWGPPRQGRAGFWRGIVAATMRGPPRGPFFEFANLWGTRAPPGTLTPRWFAEPWAPPGAGHGGSPLTGLPPAGEGGQPPEEGGGEWSAHLEDEGDVIDVPSEMELAFLDGLKPRDFSFCGRRNMYFCGSNCVGIACLKARKENAEARAPRPPGQQQPAKRKRTGDQTSRQAWMGEILARKKSIDAMAVGAEERGQAERNSNAAEAR